MSEKWKQKILLIFPFAVLAAGMILTAAFFLHTYRQIAFEHTSALCETILENSPDSDGKQGKNDHQKPVIRASLGSQRELCK